MSFLFPNESLHSLILRYHLRHGNFSDVLHDVISHKGYWKPFEHISITAGFENFSDADWFKVIAQSLTPDKNLYRYDRHIIAFNAISPNAEGRFSIIKNSYRGYIHLKINRKIRYCNSCILQDIRNYGVGYFRRDWLDLDYEYCHKHQLLLNKMTLEKGEILHRKILHILSGKCKEKQTSAESLKNSNANLHSNTQLILGNSTPCLWEETLFFISHFVVQKLA